MLKELENGNEMQGKIDDKNNYMTNEKIKKAYEILGVRGGAGRDEIERRYFCTG